MKSTKKLILTSALFSVMTFGSLSNAFAAASDPSMSDPTLYVDPSITGEDREIILNVMKTLDPDQRENVIYKSEDGKIYANKPELLDDVVVYKPVQVRSLNQDGDSVSGTLYSSPDGTEMFAMPRQQEKPSDAELTGALSTGDLPNDLSSCNTVQSQQEITPFATQPPCTGGSGPYRRVTSNASYSWESAHVYLPGGAEIEDHDDPAATDFNGDAGYIYMGGWGQNGGNVDAGLQHGTRYDNWQPMFNINNNVEGLTDRFKSKQNVNIKFNVPSSNNISLTISGVDFNTGSPVTKTYVRAATGFVLNGSNILKRNTTIAQKPENLKTTSYIHNVHWYDSLIGISSTNNHTWTGSDTYPNGYCSYSSLVSVNYVNAGEETVNIN